MANPYGYLYVVNPVIQREVTAYLEMKWPDVVHVTSCGNVTPAVILAAKRLGLPVVLTLTGKWLICPVGTLLRWDGSLCAGRQDGMTCLRCLFGRTRIYRSLTMLPDAWRQKAIKLTVSHPRLLRAVGSLNFIQAVERRNLLFPEILRQVDLVLSPSKCHIEIFSASGLLPAERIIYSPYGHRVEPASRGQHKAPSTRVRFGYTGQVFPHKGAHTLIDAFARISMDSNAQLNIFGDPNLDSAYGERVRHMAVGQSGIKFCGGFDPNTIGDVLAEIDVLVVPSECVENAPLTVAEAFAAKTPVIGSDTCGVQELIRHEVDGLLFRRGDAEDLARQMRRILQEPELLERLRAGIRPVRTVVEEADALLPMYRRLANGNTSPHHP
jgi:glycosyltransferase involved in cell wall biosynthesis